MKTKTNKQRFEEQKALRNYLMTAILPHLNLSLRQRAELADIALNMLRVNECRGHNLKGEIQMQLDLR